MEKKIEWRCIKRKPGGFIGCLGKVQICQVTIHPSTPCESEDVYRLSFYLPGIGGSEEYFSGMEIAQNKADSYLILWLDWTGLRMGKLGAF